jgi:hypothetical protein
LCLLNLLSLKTDVNVPTVNTVISRKIRSKIKFCWQFKFIEEKNRDRDPEP